MQSGTIKHWNSDKGYGFIDVDNQSEDVFFHIKSVRMTHPISEGQRVYFNSERNDKNQLRATEVTSNELSILETSALNSAANLAHHSPDNAQSRNKRNAQHKNNQHKNNQHKNNRGSKQKKSSFSTLFSLIAIIAVAVYFFADLKASFFEDSTPSTTLSQSATETGSPTNAASITGDA